MISEYLGDAVIWLTMIMDPIAALLIVIVVIVDDEVRALGRRHTLLVAIAASGLVFQAYRSHVTIITGMAPRDSELIGWVLKDISLFGLSVVAAVGTYEKWRRVRQRTGN